MKIYSEISSNKRKTWALIVLFVAIITTVVYIFAQTFGFNLSYVGLALVATGLMSFGSYYYSDQIILSTVNAREIKKNDLPQLYRVVENLCLGDGLPMPKIYLINDNSPNAFATGRDPKHAVICVTSGLLEKLSKIELEGVIAHELSHIKNYDTRLMSVVTILVGILVILGDMFMKNLWIGNSRNREGSSNAQSIFLLIGLLFAIFSPIVATIIQLAVSRKREYLADASGALLTRYPEGLASALEKIAKDPLSLKNASNATAHLFISNPFKGKTGDTWLTSLFNTHPPVAERIKILRSM